MGFLVGWALSIVADMLGGVLGLAGPAPRALFSTGMHYLIAGIGLIVTVLGIYGLIWAFLGKYAEMPLISKLARNNIQR